MGATDPHTQTKSDDRDDSTTGWSLAEIRLEGRFFGTFAGSGGFAVGCGPAGCLAGFGGDFLRLGEIVAGLIIDFDFISLNRYFGGRAPANA